jgi:hypothetical protein
MSNKEVVSVEFDISRGRFKYLYRGRTIIKNGEFEVSIFGNVVKSSDRRYKRNIKVKEVNENITRLTVSYSTKVEKLLPQFEIHFDIMKEPLAINFTSDLKSAYFCIYGEFNASHHREPLYLGRLPDNKASKVFSVAYGLVESLTADSVYDRFMDLGIKLKAGGEKFIKRMPDLSGYKFIIKGQPEFSICIYENVLKKQGIEFFKPINKKHFSHAPCGWCSWYFYYQNITEEEWEKNVIWLAKNLKQYGLEWVQIDDGWQMQNGSKDTPGGRDWRGANSKFPKGMKHVADIVHKYGMKAGLWLIPQKTDCDELYQQHPEYFLRYPDGSPVKIPDWAPGGTKQYVIDPTNPAAIKNYYIPLWKKLSDEWGFDYFKIDNQGDCSKWYGDRNHVRKNMQLSGKEVYRKSLEIIKKVIGPEKFLLGCSSFPDGIGIVDGSRTSGDMSATWGGCQVTIDAIFRYNFLNNVVWWSDPDVLCVRSPLTFEEAKLMATLISLSGQVLMLSDKMYELPEERVELLRRICPTLDIHPMEFYPWEGERPSIVDLKIAKKFGDWDVVGVFNWGDEVKEVKLSFAELGLLTERDRRYHVYEYWDKEYYGKVSEGLSLLLPKHSCKLFCIKECKPYPDVVSTSRHITQGCPDLIDLCWDEKRCVLSGKSILVPKDPYLIILSIPQVPEYYKLKSIAVSNAKVKRIEDCGGLLKLYFYSNSGGLAKWKIKFKKFSNEEKSVSRIVLKADVRESAGKVLLTWNNVFAERYRVYRNGEPVKEVWETRYTDYLFPPGSKLTYVVSAIDSEGREMQRSSELKVRIPPKINIKNIIAAFNIYSGVLEGKENCVELASGQRSYLRLEQTIQDTYKVRIGIIKWRSTGKITVKRKNKILLKKYDTAESIDTPKISWIEVCKDYGDESLLEVVAEGGPCAVVGVERIPCSKIMSWYVAGPFPNPEHSGFDEVYLPEKVPEPLKEKSLVWRKLRCDEFGYLDLLKVSTEPWVIAYAYAEAYVEEELDTEVWLGSDDGVKVWVNGVLVHSHHIHRMALPEEDKFKVHLKRGRNKLLFKVEQAEGAWGLYVRLLNPQGGIKKIIPSS